MFDRSSTTSLKYAAYALPVITMLWLHAPLVIIQGIYAKYYGLSLTTIAAIVLLGRFFDAVTDPLIGYYSDRYRRRTGTRKPFVLMGGLLMIVSGYFLYVPFSASILYFSLCLFAFYLSYTLFDIPHNAWASELAQSASEKSIIFSFRSAGILFGLVLFYAIPLLPFFETRDITPETLKVSVITAGIMMVVFLAICIKYTPDGMQPSILKEAPKSEDTSTVNRFDRLRAIYQSLIDNKPLCIFLASYISYGLGYGLWLGLVFLYVDSYLGIGELFAQVFLAAYIAGIIVTPIWCKTANKWGKKITMSLAFIFFIISFIYTGLLVPGEAGLRELLILKITNTLGASGILAIAPAMLSKIIDYSTWKSRNENTAIYYSLYAFLTKAGLAIGVAVGLAIADWYGFDATVTSQAAENVVGLLLAMVWLPVAFILSALVFTLLNPINSRRHKIIRRCLDVRARREDVTV